MIQVALLFLFFQSILVSEEISLSSSEGAFSSTATLPSDRVAIPDTLSMDLKLQYPKGYRPDIIVISRNIARFNGFGTPPFKVSSYTDSGAVEVGDDMMQQDFRFVLQPIVLGQFFLSFQNIPFETEQGGKKSEVQLFSGVFSVRISLPETIPPYEGVDPLLLMPDLKYPIEINPENLRRVPVASKENIQASLAEKSPPWTGFILLFFTLLSVMTYRKSPTAIS